MAKRTPPESVAALLPEIYALRPMDEFPAHALGIVRRAVGGEKGDYTEVDLASGDFRVLVDPEPAQLAELAEARRAHMHEHPVLGYFLSGSPSGARKISDFQTRGEFHRSTLYGEFFGHLEVEDQLTVTLARVSSAYPVVGISIDRSTCGFGERERALMECLRPHLAAAHQNSRRFSSAIRSSTGDATPKLERLTDRQLQVLTTLARGSTNAQIAAELDVSIGTVRKHTEHILRRLEVTSRTAAAAIFLRAGISPADARWTAEMRMLAGAT